MLGVVVVDVVLVEVVKIVFIVVLIIVVDVIVELEILGVVDVVKGNGLVVEGGVVIFVLVLGGIVEKLSEEENIVEVIELIIRVVVDETIFVVLVVCPWFEHRLKVQGTFII